MTKSFSTTNPYLNQKIKDWSYASVDQIQSGIESLAVGIKTWKILTYQERQKSLLQVLGQFEVKKEQFAQSITEQMGKPILQARAEVQKTLETIRILCEMNLDFLKATNVSSSYRSSQVMNEPLGVIVGIMPWNFPLWQTVRMAFPALLAGNTVLLKSSEITPEIGQIVEECFHHAGLGHVVLKHILFSHESTESILSHPEICGVSLTGSTQAGQIVGSIAGKYLKKAILELGGSDPYIVMTDAILGFATKKIIQSRLSNCGQVCISAKRVLIHESQLSEFLNLCQKEMAKFTLGDPMDEKTLLGPLSHFKFKQKYNQQVQELARYCETIEIKSDFDFEGAFVNPVILVFKENHPSLRTLEIFGPALIVISYSHLDRAIEIANSTVFGLGAAVFSQDLEKARKVAESLIAGQVAINDLVKSDVHLPFGGFKMSGHGSELGEAGFFEFTQTKVISVK
mgnify:CR=1 FL=1